jgi:type I restriction enzyme S subunit
MSNKATRMSKNDKQHALVPRLRFPEFRDSRPWTAATLDECCERLTEKVGDAQLTPVSITAGTGFVPQAEKFGRDISGAQYSNYIRIERGDFAYNRGNSKRFPHGCVYQLTEFDEAAASNAFYCFRLHKEYEPAFFEGLFESNCHGRQLLKYITSSARSDGLLNIRADTFFSIKIPMPPTPDEQRKIADCLGSLDDLIAAEGRKLAALRDHKKGLMQQLFPREGETRPRLRFPEFRDAGEWEPARLSAIFDLGCVCKL